jgi:hypothetical protein|tara:strand:- start:426 stop:698 length:273 start_codon:yes stop_codon:yes gene_type:complete
MPNNRYTVAPLPRLEEGGDPVIWASELVDQLEQTLDNLSQAANIGDIDTKFSTSNITTTKSLNANSTSTTNNANVLGSVINALREKGVLA